MSKKIQKKMMNVGINTESLNLDADSNNAIASRLKERDVKHIRINESSDLWDSYNFKEEIGKGGFATVLSVLEKHTDKQWAMKIVCKAAVGNKIETVYREIKILKMVDHPHIIYLDRVYESARKIYLVMELCYSALSKVFKEQKLFSEIDTKKIIRDLASVIAYLHKNDIVHRDLKLDNILIAKNPNDSSDELYIKVSDFGLSIVKQGSGYENMLHDCCGTIMYMAPEVIATRSYSQQCDVWATGVIMYTLLCGHYPYYSKNDQEITALICESEPSFSGFTVSSEAIHLITKMLIKNPALRITAGEIIHHPWIIGKPMTHDSNSPENVLDMMRLWRPEMMLPLGADCDWVSSAKAIESTTTISSVQNSAVLIKSHKTPHFRKEPSENVGGLGTRECSKQSMSVPVKNIRFEKATNQNANVRAAGRRTNITVGVEEPRTNRGGNNSPTPLMTDGGGSRRSSLAPKRADATSNGKPQTPNTPDKGMKSGTIK